MAATDRIPPNPTLPYAPKAPSTQEVAAMAALQRALSAQTGASGSAGATLAARSEVRLLSDPPTDVSQLYQGFFLGYRGRPAG